MYHFYLSSLLHGKGDFYSCGFVYGHFETVKVEGGVIVYFLYHECPLSY